MKGFEFLLQSRKFGMKLGLENMERLATAFENPEKKLKFIHLAGTNGKGSTAAFCAQALQESGYRTGLFTSPHLISITERIQIDGSSIPEERLTTLLDEIAEITRLWEQPPTFFEIMTAAALRYFEEEKVEWVVWETGMGGRLDSTNIVTPAVTILTQVGFDHQEYLGESLAKIAAEKGGIIKKNIPTVCGVREPEALAVIRKIAEKQDSTLIETEDLQVIDHGIKGKKQHIEIEGIPFQLSLLGDHQIQNALTAFTALFAVLKIPVKSIQRGFSKTQWNGRFQILRENPPLVVDGAHNPSSMSTLIETWKKVYAETKPTVVFAVLADKSYCEMIPSIESIADRVILVKVNNPRAVDPFAIQDLFTYAPIETAPNLTTIWSSLIDSKNPILITGSLFLVGEALHLYHPTAAPPYTQLNEILKP